LQVVHEVDPSWNVVDVHKQVIAPERPGEPIVQPTGRADCIISAVINEDHLTNDDLAARLMTTHYNAE
jgi:hypothetical protein